MKRFALFGDKTATDDQFRRSSADVHHQTLFAGWRKRMSASREDKTGFFTAGNDFNGVPERFFGTRQEVSGIRCHAQRLRTDGADVLRINSVEFFSEAAQSS